MKAFGFLSFGHYAIDGKRGPSAEQVAKIHLEIAQAADEIGVNNASFRVHHFVPQASAPMPLLAPVMRTTFGPSSDIFVLPVSPREGAYEPT